jgi:hypothetical protein
MQNRPDIGVILENPDWLLRPRRHRYQ